MTTSKPFLLHNREKLQSKLLQWFKKYKRDLPWRKTRDPYAIWVSEIMLQQTQVATVIPYYEKFLEVFPTLQHLAKANLFAVLKVWEGLGYYSRARNLHQGSRMIMNQFNGKIPHNQKDLLTISGIGRYTAGAILSIAFNQRAPILDGNVKRVLSRLYAISGSPARGKTDGLLWQLSESLLPKERAGLFNQGLMDLGAMICTPKNPQCLQCPLVDICKAYGSGGPEGFPLKSVKKKIPHVKAVSAVIQRNGKCLLRQRPATGLLGGLWEFPNWKVNGNKDLKSYVRKKVKSEIGLSVNCKEPLGSFKQAYSHFKLTLTVYRCEATEAIRKGRWVPIRSFHLLPMSRIDRKIADTVQQYPLQNKS